MLVAAEKNRRDTTYCIRENPSQEIWSQCPGPRYENKLLSFWIAPSVANHSLDRRRYIPQNNLRSSPLLRLLEVVIRSDMMTGPTSSFFMRTLSLISSNHALSQPPRFSLSKDLRHMNRSDSCAALGVRLYGSSNSKPNSRSNCAGTSNEASSPRRCPISSLRDPCHRSRHLRVSKGECPELGNFEQLGENPCHSRYLRVQGYTRT